MTEATKNTRAKKTPSLTELAAFNKATRLAIAKAAGVPVDKVNLEKLEGALEKAKIEICQALGVPTHAIELTATPASQG